MHVPSEYDYRFVSDRREEIIKVVKEVYGEVTGRNVGVYGVEKGDLSEYTTSERDGKRGISRFPPEKFRLK